MKVWTQYMVDAFNALTPEEARELRLRGQHTPAPDSVPAGLTALREALEALTSTLESIEFRVSILGMACTKEDAQRLAAAHTKARAALAAEASDETP